MKLSFSAQHKRKASTNLALAWSQLESAGALLRQGQYREAVVHMYFASFYGSQSLLADRVTGAKHQHVERELHKSWKDRKAPPQQYVRLHTRLHELRNAIDYRETYVPNPHLVEKSIKRVAKYLRFISRVVPRVDLPELLADIATGSGEALEDFSYDVYEPTSYYDVGPRLTLWLNLALLPSVKPKALAVASERLLHHVRVKHSADLAVGINSKMNQYEPLHMLMLDIDEPRAAGVEEELAKIGGYLIKTRRGFHFIGRQLIKGQEKWESTLRRIARDRRLKQIVDLEHIELSMKRGYSTLRITETPGKPFVPFFYKEL